MSTEPMVLLPETFGLELSLDGGTTWADVKECKSFDEGQIQADQNDVTSFSSTGNFRKFKPGLKQAQDGSFVIHYLVEDTQHKALRDKVGEPETVKLRATLTHPDGDDEILTAEFLITSMSRPREIGGVLEATVGIKMTGAPVYTTTA